MPLSHNSPSSSSSSSESESDSELSDQHRQQQPKVPAIVTYFRDASVQYRQSREQKIWQKSHLALVDARLALLQENWSDLLKAVKALDDALASLSATAKLQWRLPILSRLRHDMNRSVPLAMQNKRRMRADEARSLSILKQRLTKDRNNKLPSSVDLLEQNPFITDDMSSGDVLLLLAFELALLICPANSQKHTLPLSGLGLTAVPPLLQVLPALAGWYESFGGLEGAADVFDTLELRCNSLTTLPTWLPEALPKLRQLFTSNNLMWSTSPVTVVFQHLEKPDGNETTRHLGSNASSLLQEAITRTTSPDYKAYIPPLTSICVEKLKRANYELPEDTMLNFNMHWNAKRYICAGCTQVIFTQDPRSIPTSLRERYYHYDPPIRQLTKDGRLPTGTSGTACIVTSPDWTFCAPCLILHSTGDVGDESGCMCIACVATRQAWQQEQAIRWTKLVVAI